MASEPDQLDQLLQRGMAAIEHGDRAAGRELLMQYIAADDGNEQAWVWLAEAVDDPDDQIIALENALTINPLNFAARDKLDELKTGPADKTRVDHQPDQLAHWKSVLPASPIEPEDGLDNPLQCVYCGQPTAEDDKRCAHCSRNLYERKQREHTSEFLQRLFIGLSAGLFFSALQLAGPLLTFVGGNPEARSFFELVNERIVLDWFFGGFLGWNSATAITVLSTLGTRLIIFIALYVGLRSRWSLAYYAGYAVLMLDVVANIGLALLGWLGIIMVIINGGLDLVLLVLLAGCDREFVVTWERMYTRPDAVREAGDFYYRGHQYREQGRWAQAVAQWRRAVGLQPREPRYYKDLGIGYSQIGRFERSLKALEESLHQNPTDPDLPQMIQLVQKKLEQQTAQRATRSKHRPQTRSQQATRAPRTESKDKPNPHS